MSPSKPPEQGKEFRVNPVAESVEVKGAWGRYRMKGEGCRAEGTGRRVDGESARRRVRVKGARHTVKALTTNH